jgi:hypothetical protein
MTTTEGGQPFDRSPRAHFCYIATVVGVLLVGAAVRGWDKKRRESDQCINYPTDRARVFVDLQM